MSTEVDLENRDPESLNPTVQSHFEQVLGEPDGVHSIDCVWKNSYKCFTGSKNCCYKFLTVLCGLCMALYWGCCFACVGCAHIWCITPCYKIYDIFTNCYRRFYKSCVDCILGPMCEVCGLCFSQIKVQQG